MGLSLRERLGGRLRVRLHAWARQGFGPWVLGGLGLRAYGLMLMMAGVLGLAHDVGGFGSKSPGEHQLMLMMLGCLGLKARASTS